MKHNALIIDDNIQLTDSLRQNMDWESLNIQVTHVLYDALQVHEILASEQVDLIISDIRMPGLSGLQMAKETLQTHPGVKIILISAYEDFQYVQEAIRLGAFDYIEKPINLDYLSGIIRKAIVRLETDAQIKKQLEASKPAMVEKFFTDILRHSPQESRYNYSEYPYFLGLDIDNSFHLCIFIRISNAGDLKVKLGLESYHMALLNLENHIREHFSQFKLCYLLHNGNSLVLIAGRSTAVPQQFMDAAESSLHQVLSMESPFQFTVGIGSPVRTFWMLRESYENAKLALDYRFFLPEEQVFHYEDIPLQPFVPDFNLEAKYKKILDLICKNDQAALKKHLDQLYDEYLNVRINRDSLFFSISDIAGKIIGFLYKMGVDPGELDENLIRYWGNAKHFNTSRELFDWLLALATLAGSKLDTSMSSYQNRIVSMVEAYIEEHYENPELSLNEIAAFVNVSPNHLSATFKKISEKNITDLISDTRITNARELLTHTQLSIREISEKTGFSNQYYFSSCFKKITGQTPSAYRTLAETISTD